jgi:CheY-like chemotaxis protein
VNNYFDSRLEPAAQPPYDVHNLPIPVNTRVRVLLVEDAAADAAWIARELQASGLDFSLTRVQTESAFRHELELRPPDLVLSDHLLPAFSGFRALELVQQSHPGRPFIFVSGSNDPNLVARMFEAGATDYVFNHDRGDLVTAVLEALDISPPFSRPLPKDDELSSQPELDLALPPVPPPPSGPTVPDRLTLCPQCRGVFEDSGRSVDLDDYCHRHTHVIVQHQACSECVNLARTGSTPVGYRMPGS